MEDLSGYLPEYMFLSALPQIISRICHKNPDAFAVLRRIIVNVVLACPDQAIWQMMSVSRSVVLERKRICNMILDNVHHQPAIGQAITEQIKEALDLCDKLIALCITPVPDKVDKLSMEKHFPEVYVPTTAPTPQRDDTGSTNTLAYNSRIERNHGVASALQFELSQDRP
ncbi:hypothetical protein BGZ65_009387 [Modicella reniformis]|uniref:FAT domain-containing protein n=1 Tax=Modicella reniformis TaxID=1440133 RepID=A0A9P6MLG6_9FUNG|nr:hypothetical protein BGZ65_009387 [Modicella reniformis]